MDTQDPPAGLTSPTDDRATRLRLHDPEGPCREGATLCPELPGPEVAPCFVNGVPCNLRVWSAEEWAALPADLRPRNPFRGSRGSWHAIEPETP